MEQANTDPAVRAIRGDGAGRTFAAGADIHEFVRYDRGARPLAGVPSLAERDRDSAKPVVMAIHGQALGGRD